ncbi:hypothetical protein [Cellulomonas sp.]|uniref:hypothetical protein n=1 Tax=Cellulomonas sp. TaxID=40001 RepID=UPI003BAB4020
MSLDLSSALREAADHAPLGTLEPSVLGRRIRRRRATRTVARTAGGVGLAGALAVTATQTPGLLDSASRTAPGDTRLSRLPPDQVATTLPAADPDAPPGTCGWTVRAPAAASPYELGVALGNYPTQTYSSMPVYISARLTEAVAGPSAVRVVAARNGVVVAAAADVSQWDTGPLGPSSFAGGDFLSLQSCGGPDKSKALPDGDYEVYAAYAEPDTGELVALSPAEPLVVAGNAREQWCGSAESVIPDGDARVDLAGDVTPEGAASLRVTWTGHEEAEMLDQRILLVDDTTGAVVADSRAPAESESRAGGTLTPGELVALSVPDRPDGCGDGPPPSGIYRAIAVVTIAPQEGEGPTTNAIAAVELSGTVTVP